MVGSRHTIIAESVLFSLDLFFQTKRPLEMCVGIQGNECTTDKTSRILGCFEFLNKTLGFLLRHSILSGSSGRVGDLWWREQVLGVFLVMSWKLGHWNVPCKHPQGPRDLVQPEFL